MTRRTFVASAAAVAGAAGLAGVLPANLARAATMSPQKFDLSQVKHLVFLMQENRSFDHYFGTFPGARGSTTRPRSGCPPAGRSSSSPTRPTPTATSSPGTCPPSPPAPPAVPSLSHDWRDQHASWNQGAMDGWLLTHLASDGDANGSFTMGYYTQEDIPFHWALAQSFTLADNYHCSVMGPTDPNRLFWEHGGNDPQGKAGGPVLETGGVKDLTYETAPETLYTAGISYKFYHDAGWIGPGDGGPYFKQFQTPGLVPAALFNAMVSHGTLFGDGTPGGIGDPANPTAASNPSLAFEEDCANGVLPDVSLHRDRRLRAPARRSRRPARSSSRPSWRPWPPTRNCGTPPCSSSTTTRTTGSSTTSSRRPRTRRSSPRSSSPWPRRPAPPAAACPSAPASGCRPSSSRPGRWAAGSSPRSPTTPPACGWSRRSRRPAACPARARLPSPTSAAGGGRPSATSPGPCARRGAGGPVSTQFTPATTAANLAAQQVGLPAAAAAAPRRDPAVPVEPR